MRDRDLRHRRGGQPAAGAIGSEKVRPRTVRPRTRTIGRRVVPLGGAALGLAALLAGCGSSGSAGPSSTSPSSPTVVLSAYKQTVGGKSADVAFSETITATPSGGTTKQATILGSGSVDFSTGDESVTSTSATVGTTTEHLVAPVLYIEVPSTDRSQLPAGKSWVEINLNTVSEANLGESYSQLLSSSQQSTQTLSYLQGVASSGITTIGTATIRGVPTTEYQATVDLTKVADQKSPAEEAAIKSVEAELHTSSLPIRVWLDAQGRVRQMSDRLDARTSATASSGTTLPAASEQVSETIDYYNFGTPVTVTAPPAADVDNITAEAVTATTAAS